MAALVSKDSEGIYTDLASPDQDVYSTLGQTSLNSPGAQHKGHSGQSSHPYRRAAVCLGLLCALLLAATLVLCVLYTSLSGHYSMLERDLEELRSNCSTMNKEKVQQQKNCSTLERKLEELRTSCNMTMVQQQRKYNEVFKKLAFSEQYCPSSSQSGVCKPCPHGWSLFSSKCYYFSNEKKYWTDSRSDCLKQGADLVIIESEEEQWFITNKAKYYTWIGLSYSASKRNWLWVDGTPLQKGFWGSAGPAYQTGSNCATIITNMNTWAAYSCNNNLNWICEADALLP